MKKIYLFLFVFLFFSSCSEMFLIDFLVHYPFDDQNQKEYSINIDDGMTSINNLFENETEEKLKEIVKTELPSDFSSEDFDIDNLVSLQDLMNLISGKTVTKTVTAKRVVQGKTIEKTVSVDISLCDFPEQKTISDDTVSMEIKNFDEFCGLNGKKEDKTKKPYLYIEYNTDPMQIQLSKEDDLKDYKQYLSKIYSASMNNLALTLTEIPEGFSVNSEDQGSTKTVAKIRADFFAQKIKLKKEINGAFVDCFDETDKDCSYKGVDDEGIITDFYEKELPDNPFWIGKLSSDESGDMDLKQDAQIKLFYTYNGQEILQKSIKNLDFQIGIKSIIEIYPGSKIPSGTLKATVSADFYFVVEPLN